MLSNACKYAIRAVIYIALNGNEKKIGIKEIANELKMPEHFLGKIMQKLVKKNILHSAKGPNGGFYFSKGNNISLYDIVASIEGTDIFERCLISFRSCNEEKKPCPIHNEYEIVRNELVAFYKKQLIYDIAKNIKDSNIEFVL